MSTEFIAEGGQDLRAIRVVLAGPETGLQRQRDDRRRDILVDRLLDRPASLARIGDPALEVLEVLVAGERPLRQLEQPRADHGAVIPQCRDLLQVERVVARVHDLEPLGVGLHEAVLDAVVNHLHVMPGAGAADMQVAVLRRERQEDRLEALHRLRVAADHQAEAVGEAPDPSRHASIDVFDALLLQLGMAPLVVVEVRVAAVDDRVAGLEVLEQLLDLRLGRVAGRDHDPDGPRLLQLADQLGDRERAVGALAGDLLRLFGGPVVRDDFVLVAQQAANHVRAHPPQADESDAHLRQASEWGLARAWPRACSSVARAASGSSPRWTRAMGRSCDSIDPKSPAAWASMSWPKVCGQPGIGRSFGWSDVSWRNQPIGAPPLWSCPVEWRKRGP